MANFTSGWQRRVTWWLWALAVTVAAGLSSASSAWAQAGWYVTPSVSLSESYDDNVFSTPQNLAPEPTPIPGETPVPVESSQRSKADDFVFNATPGIEAGYQSEPFSLLASYKLGADVYAERSELNSAPSRQELTLRGFYLPDPSLTLALAGGFIESKYARELNSPVAAAQTGLAVTGLERTRSRAETYFANPTVTYAYDPLTTGSIGYAFAESRQIGAPSSQTHQGLFSLARTLTPVDTVDMTYTFRHFVFDDVPVVTEPTPAAGETPPPEPSATPTPAATPVVRTRKSSENSHAITVGWGRQLTELTNFVVRGGPRIREGGAIDPEIQATLGRQIERGEISLSYLRTQATAVGLEGAFDTQTIAANLKYELLLDLTTNLGLSYYRTSRSSESADVYAASLNLRYRMLEWLYLFGSYNFTYQKGVFETEKDTPKRDEDVYHSIVTIGVEALEPFRVY